MYIVIPLYIVSLLWMLFASIKLPNSWQRLAAKCTTSLLFVAVTVTIGIINQLTATYFYLILSAQILSLLGDLFLGFSNVSFLKKYRVFFILGFSFFFIAQLVYIYTFTFFGQVPFNSLHIIIPTIGVLISVLIMYKLHVKDRLRFSLICIYSVVMAGMLGATVLYTNFVGFNQVTIFVFIGGIVFALSDYTLLFKYFYHGKRKKLFVFITTITYYIAQLFFALSLL